MLLTGDYSELETMKEVLKDLPKETPTEDYRPYRNSVEFYKDLLITGGLVQRKNLHNSPSSFVVKFGDNGCTFMSPISNEFITVSYHDLLNEYTWGDGTPCGVKKQIN